MPTYKDVEDVIAEQAANSSFMAKMQTIATLHSLSLRVAHRMFALWVHPTWLLFDVAYAKATASPIDPAWAEWKRWYINGKAGGPDTTSYGGISISTSLST